MSVVGVRVPQRGDLDNWRIVDRQRVQHDDGHHLLILSNADNVVCFQTDKMRYWFPQATIENMARQFLLPENALLTMLNTEVGVGLSDEDCIDWSGDMSPLMDALFSSLQAENPSRAFQQLSAEMKSQLLLHGLLPRDRQWVWPSAIPWDMDCDTPCTQLKITFGGGPIEVPIPDEFRLMPTLWWAFTCRVFRNAPGRGMSTVSHLEIGHVVTSRPDLTGTPLGVHDNTVYLDDTVYTRLDTRVTVLVLLSMDIAPVVMAAAVSFR